MVRVAADARVSQIPGIFNGRYERLYELRALYNTAVASTAAPKTSSRVERTGVKLALLASFNGDHLATLLRVVRVPLPFGS